MHRFLHWALAFGIIAQLLTGFLHIFWMNKKTMAQIMGKAFGETSLTKEQLIDAAKAIREPMWQWHMYVAYFVAVIFIFRLGYMFIKGVRFPKPFSKEIDTLERIQGFTYLCFYLFLAFSIFSGIIIKWGEKGDFRETVEAIHKFGLYFYSTFIILHLGGIYLEEKRKKDRIASKMFSGD